MELERAKVNIQLTSLARLSNNIENFFIGKIRKYKTKEYISILGHYNIFHLLINCSCLTYKITTLLIHQDKTEISHDKSRALMAQ